MNVDFKVTAWERVVVDGRFKDQVIEKLKSKEIEYSNQLFDFIEDLAENDDELPILEDFNLETVEQMSVEENNGCATIEISGENPEQDLIYSNA